MNKKFSKDPYELVRGDKVLLQKFFSSKHLKFTGNNEKAVGEFATFIGFAGYRDRQAIIELYDGFQLYWRTESLKYVKQHTKEEISDILGYGQIEPVEIKFGSSAQWSTAYETLSSINSNNTKVGIIPTPDAPNLIMYGRIEVCNKELCEALDKENCTCDEDSIQKNGRNNKSLNQKVTDSSMKFDYSTTSPSEALIKDSFTTQVITEERAIEILRDPGTFYRQLEKAVEKVVIYPEFDQLTDITNPYDILKELIRLKTIFNSMPGDSFEYIVSFEANHTNHKIITVKLKDFNRSMFTFNTETKAKVYLEKYGEYLKIISKTFY